MMSVEEKKKLEDAFDAKDCLDWHKHCNAECCRMIFLGVTHEDIKGNSFFIKIPAHPNYDERRYYKYHDVNYVHGNLMYRRDRCFVVDGDVVYKFDCENLVDCKCILHPDGKPSVCKELTEEKTKSRRFRVTKNCLFRYKEMIRNGKKE